MSDVIGDALQNAQARSPCPLYADALAEHARQLALAASESDTVAVDRRMLQEVLRDLPPTNLIAGYFRKLLAGGK